MNGLRRSIKHWCRVEWHINRFLQTNNDKIKNCIVKRLYRSFFWKKYGIILGLNAKASGDICFPHPQNIVIGDGVTIGSDCIVFHNVTIGRKDDFLAAEGKYPVIGNNVTLCVGAVIVGDIHIGDGAMIGANAVVLSDVPAGAVAVGVPARVIKMSE